MGSTSLQSNSSAGSGWAASRWSNSRIAGAFSRGVSRWQGLQRPLFGQVFFLGQADLWLREVHLPRREDFLCPLVPEYEECLFDLTAVHAQQNIPAYAKQRSFPRPQH